MILAIAICAAVFWVVAGTASFIYWWTSEFDATVGTIIFGTAIGCLFGPLAFPVGWMIHARDGGREIIVFRARMKK